MGGNTAGEGLSDSCAAKSGATVQSLNELEEANVPSDTNWTFTVAPAGSSAQTESASVLGELRRKTLRRWLVHNLRFLREMCDLP
jgi:hypothetical protein